ncbi:MAG: ABC transporter ATP-binding protein [Actinomycetota bacterium]|nr:ABC transporter ATP-binding protein [Actinomycetota bacterium]
MSNLAIRTEGLSKYYGPVHALSDLSMEVTPGEVFGFLGPNGAGKTTTIRLLLGLIHPSAGRAEIFGLDCHRNSVEVHRKISYVPGDAGLWPSLTGEETLHLLGRVHGKVDEDYRNELVKRFNLDVTRKIRTYSRGNRQKVILISALMTRPELMILDEPTTGLDPIMEHEFRHCVDEAMERGQTVFLSSHILSEVEAICDRVGILRDGRLIEIGTLEEMRHLSALTIEATFVGEIPDLSKIPGVGNIRQDGRSVSLQFTGSLKPLLEMLAASEVSELVSREPSLEELFISLYGDHQVPKVIESNP